MAGRGALGRKRPKPVTRLPEISRLRRIARRKKTIFKEETIALLWRKVTVITTATIYLNLRLLNRMKRIIHYYAEISRHENL